MGENEYIKDLFYVSYCNCCKDLDVMDSKEVPCHHPWYCHMDKGEVQELEFNIAFINHNIWLRGYSYAYERKELYELKEKKFNLVKEKLREFRKNQRKGVRNEV